MIIAVDGPAGAGKGTIAKMLAKHFGFAYLDTGLLYRAVGMKCIDANDAQQAIEAAKSLNASDLQREGLRTQRAAENASKVAAIPEVRATLLEFQRTFAHNPPAGEKGVVLDGRDIGTVVCQQAECKLFLTASAEERATRRVKQLQEAGEIAIFTTILAEIKARDARDSTRTAAPLVPAKDAHIIDTSNKAIDQVFNEALQYANKCSNAANS